MQYGVKSLCRSAWDLSIHEAQNLPLDRVASSLCLVFTFAMVHVALSRDGHL